jgi:hypothetical protein
MNLDFNVLIFITGFVFSLPIIGYLFRFQIPISLFFFMAGTFMIAIFLTTDGIILNDRPNLVVDNDPNFNITYEDNVMDISLTGDNYQIKVFLIFVSVMFMVGGALVEIKGR